MSAHIAPVSEYPAPRLRTDGEKDRLSEEDPISRQSVSFPEDLFKGRVSKKGNSVSPLIDGPQILGSANWSYKGLHINREADLDVVSEEVTSVFEKLFKKDWEERSTPVNLEDLQGRRNRRSSQVMQDGEARATSEPFFV